MPTTIFFSWQLDTPPTTGRNFVERALSVAVARLATDIEIQEAVREGLEVDHDTKDVPGTPPIVDTIFAKITAASAFVPDLTFVSKRIDGRPAPNPNVLVEYGYALRSLGHSKMVPVMNTAFGEPKPEVMPFDMLHLRRPITYRLPDDASPELKKAQRDELARQLERQLRLVLKASAVTPPEAIEAFPAAAANDGPSCFLKPGEPIKIFQEGFRGQEQQTLLVRGPHIYLRVIPTKLERRFTPIELEDFARRRHSLKPMSWHGGDWGPNEHGFTVTGPRRDNGETSELLQIFRTGELWAIDASNMRNTEDGRGPLHNAFEHALVTALGTYRDAMIEGLGLKPPFRWVAGMTDLRGRSIYKFKPPHNKVWVKPLAGPCQVSVIEGDGTIGAKDDPAQVLEPFFSEVWAEFGVDRAAMIGAN